MADVVLLTGYDSGCFVVLERWGEGARMIGGERRGWVRWLRCVGVRGGCQVGSEYAYCDATTLALL